MNALVNVLAIAVLAASVAGIPQGYTAPSSGSFIGGGSSGGGSFISSSGGGSSSGFSSNSGGFVSTGGGGIDSGFIRGGGGGFSSGGLGGSLSFDGCGEGEVRRADGSCVKAQVSRNIFLYAAPPAQEIKVGPAPELPNPKVHYNFVFVRTPETLGGAKPVVVPPPQQKTLVYVLTKRPGVQDQEIIEVPSTPTQPEVFFVNYGQGDNPDLPGGISLQQALSQSAQQAQFIDANEGGANIGGGGGDISGIVDLRGGSTGGGNFISGGTSDISSGGFISTGGISGGGISGGGIITSGGGGSFVTGGNSISAPSTQYSSP